MKVSEFMSTELITIDANSPIRNALKLMEKKKVSRLLVTKNKEIVGIVTMKDISKRLGSEKERKLSDAHIYVSSCYTKELITIPKDAELKEAAKLMLQHGISSLVVTDNSRPVGLITKTDLIKSLLSSEKKVREYMHRKVTVLAPSSSILEARKLMIMKKISRIPVVRGDELVGIVTHSDIAEFFQKFRQREEGKHWDEKLKHYTLEHIMSRDVITINADDTLAQAARIMLEKDISGLPVLENNKLVGIITKTDLVRAIAEG